MHNKRNSLKGDNLLFAQHRCHKCSCKSSPIKFTATRSFSKVVGAVDDVGVCHYGPFCLGHCSESQAGAEKSRGSVSFVNQGEWRWRRRLTNQRPWNWVLAHSYDRRQNYSGNIFEIWIKGYLFFILGFWNDSVRHGASRYSAKIISFSIFDV